MKAIALIAALCALPLGACSELGTVEGQMTADAGEAVQHNIAAQLVNPNAPMEKGPFLTSGERAARAQDRYVKGKVIQPESVSAGKQDAASPAASSPDSAEATPPAQ